MQQEALPEANAPIQPLVREPSANQAEPGNAALAFGDDEDEKDESREDEAPASGPSDSDVCHEEGGSELYCVYTVEEGDSLSTIAAAFGVQGTPTISASDLIAISNHLSDIDALEIQPDDELIVPLKSGVIHTVHPAEVLSNLAQLYGVDIDDITAANGITDPNAVRAGMAILIPDPVIWPVWLTSPGSGSTAATTEENASTEVEATAETEEPATATPTGEATTAVEEPTATETAAPESTATTPPTQEPTATPTEEPPPTSTSEPTAEPEREADAPAPMAASATEPAAETSSDSSGGTAQEQFASGFRSVGGSESTLQHLMDTVIPCESSWNTNAYNPAGPFYGLLQFLPPTWRGVGGGDWFDPWQQGANAARLLQSSTPSSQWPHCW